jgi:uncharacterized protein YndB with AHSA1/START domain
MNPATHAETTVRTSVVVEAPISIAFDVFTTQFNAWWPRAHHISAAELDAAVIEPHVGGRWYERDVDGGECDWGVVLAYDPPNHVAMSWHLNAEFAYDADPTRASRVDVRFTAEAADRTRVVLEHSQLDRHGDAWRRLAEGVGGDDGWPGILAGYAVAVARR